MRTTTSLKLKARPSSRRLTRVSSSASGRNGNGLSHGQETALGLLGSRRQGDTFDLLDVNPASLSAKVHYRPDLPVYDWEEHEDQAGLANTATRMYVNLLKHTHTFSSFLSFFFFLLVSRSVSYTVFFLVLLLHLLLL